MVKIGFKRVYYHYKRSAIILDYPFSNLMDMGTKGQISILFFPQLKAIGNVTLRELSSAIF